MPFSDSLNSRIPLPTERATSGSRCGPRKISATTRITINSSGPGAEMNPMVMSLPAGVAHSGAKRRVQCLDRGLTEVQLARDLVHDHVPRRPRRAVGAKPGRVPAVGVAAGLPLVAVQPRHARGAGREPEHAARGPRGALLVVLGIAA